MSLLKDREKRRLQVSFRIGEKAWARLVQTARIFELSESAYVKALLYANLNIYDERIDHRRKPWRQRQEREKQK